MRRQKGIIIRRVTTDSKELNASSTLATFRPLFVNTSSCVIPILVQTWRSLRFRDVMSVTSASNALICFNGCAFTDKTTLNPSARRAADRFRSRVQEIVVLYGARQTVAICL